MKILTEAMLRAMTLPEGSSTYCVEPDVFVTPLAKEYLRDRGITLKISEREKTAMTRTPIPASGKCRFVDAVTGQGYEEKPEHMTHLRGNILVSKTHSRIEFRGKLDSLQAEIICLQAEAALEQAEQLVSDLGEILRSVQNILGSEVKDEPVGDIKLFGLNDKQIREYSHNVKKHIGIDHPIPDYRYGIMAAKLNLLRTAIRETELAAARAFIHENGEIERPDIIQSLNRLSSGIYIVYCRWIKGWYKGGHS